MQATPIGGARMNGILAGLFNQTVTIQQPTIGQNAMGEVTRSFANRTGCVNIPAQVGPVDVGVRVRPQETRLDHVTQVRAQRRCILNDDYPTIDFSDHCVWNGIAWNILAIVRDTRATFTELLLDEVIPGDV